MKQLSLCLLILLAVSLTTSAAYEKVKPKLELQEIQEFIGQWKGVGQLKRGST